MRQPIERTDGLAIAESILSRPRTPEQIEERVRIAGATLDTEICARHGKEYAVWSFCPDCSEEREVSMAAAHYARKRFDSTANLFPVEESDFPRRKRNLLRDDPDDGLTAEEQAYDRELTDFWRRVAIGAALLLIGALLGAWWRGLLR